ncbi:SRPBCC domain-containing protein [Sphingobacterium corticis]|uniref:SRPBCC domain-containing protein n=1 Tax=Sphingobacterium corticis TaxID=1812823 RepID=A0ABW5NNX4_9SPHI
MEKLHFEIKINAPAKIVVEQMIGKETYPKWTKPFSSTSDFEGGWNKGDKILFTSLDKEGNKHGMVAKIAEHIPNEFISIHHYGVLEKGKEITEGPAVDSWANCFENYYYQENNGKTTVRVEVDSAEDHADYMESMWPKALDILKQLCEA